MPQHNPRYVDAENVAPTDSAALRLSENDRTSRTPPQAAKSERWRPVLFFTGNLPQAAKTPVRAISPRFGLLAHPQRSSKTYFWAPNSRDSTLFLDVSKPFTPSKLGDCSFGRAAVNSHCGSAALGDCPVGRAAVKQAASCWLQQTGSFELLQHLLGH